MLSTHALLSGHLFSWMVKAERLWPRPQHVAWEPLYWNFSTTLLEPSLCGPPAYLNPSTCTFSSVSAFPGLTAPAIPSLKTAQREEMQGFIQYPNSESCLKETNIGGPTHNANHASLQKKFLIFDHSGNKTRVFYGPAYPLAPSPIITATKFAHAYDVNKEGQVSNMGQKYVSKYSLPEECEKDHLVHEEGDMHEDTEEINALLYSDDDDDYDEVTSTGRSPLATKRTYVMREQFEDTMEDVASSDWLDKRQKLIDGGHNRLSPPVDNASSLRQNEINVCVSDAESKYSSGGAYSVEKTKVVNFSVGDEDIQLKKNKIRELLGVLENFIPGAKGKQPLLVIDGAIEYLKSLMSQGSLGVKYL